MPTRSRSPLIRGLALLGLCSWLVGCHKWVVVDPPYSESITAEQPVQIRITTSAGDEVKLYGTEVKADSILGYERSGDANVTAVGLDQVESVDERKADAAGTAALALGIPLAIALAAVITYAAVCPADYICD